MEILFDKKSIFDGKVMPLTENRITLLLILERFAASATKLHEM